MVTYKEDMWEVGKMTNNKKVVWLLTKGDGSDGNEWDVISIYSTKELAEKAKELYERPELRYDGSTHSFEANIEEWDIDEVTTS